MHAHNGALIGAAEYQGGEISRPALSDFLLVLALNTAGDNLRDTLDPRLRGR